MSRSSPRTRPSRRPALDDPGLHRFTGGTPLGEQALRARYELLAVRRWPDGDQLWGNWVLRVRENGAAIGTVQATLPSRGPAPARPRSHGSSSDQRRDGYAHEAARSLTARLADAGWSVAAYIHPGHRAFERVALAAEMRRTDIVRDGEHCWIRRA